MNELKKRLTTEERSAIMKRSWARRLRRANQKTADAAPTKKKLTPAERRAAAKRAWTTRRANGHGEHNGPGARSGLATELRAAEQIVAVLDSLSTESRDVVLEYVRTRQ